MIELEGSVLEEEEEEEEEQAARLLVPGAEAATAGAWPGQT